MATSGGDSREDVRLEVCSPEAIIEHDQTWIIDAVGLQGRLAPQQLVQPLGVELGQDMFLTDDGRPLPVK